MESDGERRAVLSTISFNRLSSDQDEDAHFQLFDAAHRFGFFYLDLRDTPGVLSLVSRLHVLMKDFFDLDLSEKSRYDVSQRADYFGYKGKGKSYIDKIGTPDCNEFYIISKDDILGVGTSFDHPPLIYSQRQLVKDFTNTSHAIATVILRSLSASLKLQSSGTKDVPSSDVLPSLHLKLQSSQDSVTFIKYPYSDSEAGNQPLASHTDYGSLTLVFPDSPGLQLLVATPEGERWKNVVPKEGHAIVNCGDALSLLTRNVIRSNIHRVASQLERGATAPRYTLGYFSRPLNDIPLEPMKGAKIPHIEHDLEQSYPTTRDWVSRRYQSRLLHRYKGEKAWDKTTGTEEHALAPTPTDARVIEAGTSDS